MIDWGPPLLSLRRQCALLGLHRSSLYDVPVQESAENLWLMRLIDEQYTRPPFYGSRRMTAWLRGAGYAVNRKRVVRLMGEMGLEAISPRPRLSTSPVAPRGVRGRNRAAATTGRGCRAQRCPGARLWA
jgi:putative transposase